MLTRGTQEKNVVAAVVFGSHEVKPVVTLLHVLAHGEVRDAKITYNLLNVAFRVHSMGELTLHIPLHLFQSLS